MVPDNVQINDKNNDEIWYHAIILQEDAVIKTVYTLNFVHAMFVTCISLSTKYIGFETIVLYKRNTCKCILKRGY